MDENAIKNNLQDLSSVVDAENVLPNNAPLSEAAAKGKTSEPMEQDESSDDDWKDAVDDVEMSVSDDNWKDALGGDDISSSSSDIWYYEDELDDSDYSYDEEEEDGIGLDTEANSKTGKEPLEAAGEKGEAHHLLWSPLSAIAATKVAVQSEECSALYDLGVLDSLVKRDVEIRSRKRDFDSLGGEEDDKDNIKSKFLAIKPQITYIESKHASIDLQVMEMMDVIKSVGEGIEQLENEYKEWKKNFQTQWMEKPSDDSWTDDDA